MIINIVFVMIKIIMFLLLLRFSRVLVLKLVRIKIVELKVCIGLKGILFVWDFCIVNVLVSGIWLKK